MQNCPERGQCGQQGCKGGCEEEVLAQTYLPTTAPARFAWTQPLRLQERCAGGGRGCAVGGKLHHGAGKGCSARDRDNQCLRGLSEWFKKWQLCQTSTFREKIWRCEGSSSQQNNENCCCCLETAPTQSSSTMPFQLWFGKVCYQDILHTEKSKRRFSGRHNLSKQPLETLSQCRDGPGCVLAVLAPSSSSASPPPRGQPALASALPPLLTTSLLSLLLCHICSIPRQGQGHSAHRPMASIQDLQEKKIKDQHYSRPAPSLWNFSLYQDPKQLCLGLI